MPSPEQVSPSHVGVSANDLPLAPSAALGPEPGRIADLVARGQLAFPPELPARDAEWLRSQVSERRRRRLVQFIARGIAQDILQTAKQRLEGD